MRSDSAYRQAALASYGTLYLRDLIELEQWYRHGIFWEARFQFRDAAGRLVADDFITWIGALRERGALRLSMHARPAQLPDHLRVEWSKWVLIAHYPNRHQVWALGEELVETLGGDITRPVEHVYFPKFPDAGYYAGAVDSYWLVSEGEGVPDVTITEWRSYSRALLDELTKATYRRVAHAKLPPYQPYLTEMRADSEWAQLPVVPASPHIPWPHQMMALLASERGQFDNDTATKNESSLYIAASQDVVAAMDAWSARIDQWRDDVLMRAANELDRQKPPAARATTHAPAASTSPAQPVSDASTPESLPEIIYTDNTPQLVKQARQHKTVNALGWVVAFAVITVMVIAIAKIIAAFPWAAIVIALPILLVAKSRK
jgi:hypothetical protein